MMSMAASVPISQLMTGSGETYKRPAQYSGEDFSGVPEVKRPRYETGGLPVKGQGQNADWRCFTVDPADKSRTYYVFNLMLKTTTSDLFKFFAKFGDLTKCSVFSDHEGKSTGTGIVQYVNRKDAIAALAAQPHFIHRKQVVISHDLNADPKANRAVKRSLEKHKLYVTDMPLNMSEEDLCEYFSQWGNISNCSIAEHAMRTIKTKYGLVSFASYEGAVRCLSTTHNYGQRVMKVYVAANCTALSDVKESIIKHAYEDRRNETNKLFVSNLPLEATSNDLKEHFSMWGKVNFCSIGRKDDTNPGTKNDNFGFVCFQELEDALKAVMMPHTLKHKQIFVSVAEKFNKALLEAYQDPKIRSAVQQKVQNCHILVSNVNGKTTEEELHEYFKKYGPLGNCVIEKSGADKCIAFLAYVKEADAARCLQDIHSLNQTMLHLCLFDMDKWKRKGSKSLPTQRSASPPRHKRRSSPSKHTRPASSRHERHSSPNRHARPASPRHERRSSPNRHTRPASPPRHERGSSPSKHTRTASSRHERHSSPNRHTRPASPRHERRSSPSKHTRTASSRHERHSSPNRHTRPASPPRHERRASPPVPHKAEPPKNVLRVSGLPAHTSAYTLMFYFSRWGRIEDVDVVKDVALRPSGCAFVIFEKHGDAENAVSDKPHVIDDKEVEVTYAKPHEELPSESFPSWREQGHCEAVQQQRLHDSIKSLDQGNDAPEVTEYECNVLGCLFKGKSEHFERHWTTIHEATVFHLICPICSMECVDADDLCEHLDFFHGIEDRSELSTYLRYAKQQERDNVLFIKPGSVTRETCMKLIKPPLKKDAKEVLNCTECTFTGTVDEFLSHWDKIHLLGLNSLRCPKCPKTFLKKDFLLLHMKKQHQNAMMTTVKEPEDIKDNFEASPNFSVGSMPQMVYHELQRQKLPRPEMGKTTISDIDSGSGGNMSMQTLPRASLGAPLQSGQNMPWPQLPILPSQQPVPRSDQPLLASLVPTQQALPLQGQVTPFYPSTASVPKLVPPPLTPSPLPPPLPLPAHQLSVGNQSYSPAYPQPLVSLFSNTSTRQPVVAAVSIQSYKVPPERYSQAPVQPQINAQFPQACVVAAAQPQVVAPVAPSVVPPPSPHAGAPLQLPLTGQMITQSASAQQPEFVMEQPPFASVAPSVVPPPSPCTGAPLQLPLTGEMITQSASIEPPEFVMKQPPFASQSVILPREHPSSIPKPDAQDLIDLDKGNIKPQEMETFPHRTQSEPEIVTENKANDELKRSIQPGSILALRPEWTKTLKATFPKKPSLDKTSSENKSSFTTEVKFIPKFDRTHQDTIQKFLLWSHIMMERLEDANIKVRKRLKADGGEGDVTEENDDEDPEEMLEFSSDEETRGGICTAVKLTLSQAHEDMKARAQTVAQKVVADYRSRNRYTKATVASNKGQSGNGVGKQGLVDKKVLGQLFHKAIGMVKYLSKRANVDGDIVRKGVSWVRQDIKRMLRQNKVMNCETDEKSTKASVSSKSDDRSQYFRQRTNKGEQSVKGRRDNSDQSRKKCHQRTENRSRANEDIQERTDNGHQSRKECQQRTDNHLQTKEQYQHRTGNCGRANEYLQQRTGNGDQSRKQQVQRTDNCDGSRDIYQHRTENHGQSSEELQHWTEDNLGQSREEFPGRRDWNVEHEEHVEVYMDEYVNEGEEYALAYIDEDGVHVMDEGGNAEREERMDEETEEEYLEYSNDDRTSFSSARNISVRMESDEYGSPQSVEGQMPRESVFVEEVEYFNHGNECFVEEENEGFMQTERVVELVNYNEYEGAFNTAWTESAEQDDRILPGQGSSLGRVDGRLEGDRGFSNQYDSFMTDNSVTRGSQGRGLRVHSKSSRADKSVRRTDKERNRGWEIPEHSKSSSAGKSVRRIDKERNRSQEIPEHGKSSSADKSVRRTGKERNRGREIPEHSKSSSADKSVRRTDKERNRGREIPEHSKSSSADKSVRRTGKERNRGQEIPEHSKSSSADKSVRRTDKERNRGQEIPEHTEHFRKHDSMKRGRKDFVDGGTTLSQNTSNKEIGDREYHRSMASTSKTKSQYLKKKGVCSKNKDQKSSNYEKKRKGKITEENEGDQQKQDDISEGVLSADGSICEYDMDGVDMGDFVVMDEV